LIFADNVGQAKELLLLHPKIKSEIDEYNSNLTEIEILKEKDNILNLIFDDCLETLCQMRGNFQQVDDKYVDFLRNFETNAVLSWTFSSFSKNNTLFSWKSDNLFEKDYINMIILLIFKRKITFC